MGKRELGQYHLTLILTRWGVVWYKRSSACKVDFLNIEYNMMDNSLGQQEGEVGVLVRAYRRASSQISHERETVTEVPQGEIVSGVMRKEIQTQCLRVPGLEALRVNLGYVRLLGQKEELRLFKGWLVKEGEQLPRWQRKDQYSGQVSYSVQKGVHIITERRGLDGVLFMTPGGVFVEVHFGDVEQLEARYGKKERVPTPSADEVAKERIEQLNREEEQRRG
jgi:hypothetical protein